MIQSVGLLAKPHWRCHRDATAKDCIYLFQFGQWFHLQLLFIVTWHWLERVALCIAIACISLHATSLWYSLRSSFQLSGLGHLKTLTPGNGLHKTKPRSSQDGSCICIVLLWRRGGLICVSWRLVGLVLGYYLGFQQSHSRDNKCLLINRSTQVCLGNNKNSQTRKLI